MKWPCTKPFFDLQHLFAFGRVPERRRVDCNYAKQLTMNLPFREKENHLQRCLGSGYTSSQGDNDFHNLIFTIFSVATTRSLSVSLSLSLSLCKYQWLPSKPLCKEFLSFTSRSLLLFLCQNCICMTVRQRLDLTVKIHMGRGTFNSHQILMFSGTKAHDKQQDL